MPDLTAQAEEALLGALLADPGQLSSVTVLVASDFTDPQRQALWTAVNRLREVAPGASGPEFADLVFITSKDDLITPDYLTRLALSCPTPAAADVYARIVLDAALTRDIAEDTAQLAGVIGRDDYAAAALASYGVNMNAARAAAAEDLNRPGPPPDDQRALQEESYLAALMRDPRLADWIRLDPDIFTSPGRRDLYQAITYLTQNGEPVDSITLAWTLARHAAARDVLAGQATTPETFGLPPGTIARLAATPADTATALETGRDLLASHARAQIAAARDAARQQPPPDTPGRSSPRSRDGIARDQAAPLLEPPGEQIQPPPGRQLGQEGS
ncbi:MAG TPA: DnaB-like helicase N-terminal domain-containing protein [Streptosporangiaceae bacterium]|jgi:hypothetical protein